MKNGRFFMGHFCIYFQAAFSARTNRINVLAAADRPHFSFITSAIVRRIGSSTGRTATSYAVFCSTSSARSEYPNIEMERKVQA